MKQHITQSDLNKLTEKGKERLKKWWESNYYGKPIPGSSDHINDTGEYFDPLLTIGQMIEFLDGHDIDWFDELHWVSREDTIGPIIVKGYGDKELCDALWSLCVEILNKE